MNTRIAPKDLILIAYFSEKKNPSSQFQHQDKTKEFRDAIPRLTAYLSSWTLSSPGCQFVALFVGDLLSDLAWRQLEREAQTDWYVF